MFECPVCKKPTITKKDKFFLGPVKSVECPECHSSISVPFYTLFYVILYFIIILMVSKLSLKVTDHLLILFSSCLIFIYLEYRFLPLIKKLKVTDEAYRKRHRKNIAITIMYLILALSLFLFFIIPTQYEIRHHLINDLEKVDQQIDRLGHLLDNRPGDDLFIKEIENIKQELLRTMYGYSKSYSLSKYLDLMLFEGLDRIIYEYQTKDSISEYEITYLYGIYKLNNASDDIRNKSLYHLSINPFKRFEIPEKLKRYESQMKTLYTDYLSQLSY